MKYIQSFLVILVPQGWIFDQEFSDAEEFVWQGKIFFNWPVQICRGDHLVTCSLQDRVASTSPDGGAEIFDSPLIIYYFNALGFYYA